MDALTNAVGRACDFEIVEGFLTFHELYCFANFVVFGNAIAFDSGKVVLCSQFVVGAGECCLLYWRGGLHDESG